MPLPATTRALVIRENAPYHDAVVERQPLRALRPGEVLVKIGAAALNHRDVWIRKGLYPKIAFGSTFGSDGAGTVVAAADPHDALLGQRVFLTPMRGWEKSPAAPESAFGTVGGTAYPPLGTFAEHVIVERTEVIRTPVHLTDVQAAAWPLAGLTAWRALSLGGVQAGSTVLITGIGGGVALLALQLSLALGARVYVTSSSPAKITRAAALGASGGVLYTAPKWAAELGKLLARDGVTGGVTVVIDGAGSEIMQAVSPVLAQGGRVVCYGMTDMKTPRITMTMREVMRNQQLIGSTMGSKAELIAATRLLEQKKIVPVVAAVVEGLENAEQGFVMMEKGSQFGKIVVTIGDKDQTAAEAKL
ncbi:NAD(P)-binding protein [Mycena indigotica]|uniref:NAD(P)-binding protein n=1 Tax=Mycena indigotica TaxID=2126181 RepID=A0A8H6VWZ5_9AGAR|nr:NAD(P)-binding protein [Mycena indigotica]KAF7291249.1 NAD(P)-binding protein [Mycena indigotica]